MSNSTRRPYSTHTINCGAKRDKRTANRSVRRRQNQWLATTLDFEEALLPHRYECSDNDVWGWSRDGKQHYNSLSQAWAHYCEGCNLPYSWRRSKKEPVWPPDWYTKLLRK